MREIVTVGGKKRATNWMNLSQLRRAVWLRRLSAASQSRFTLLKNHYRLGWLSAKTLFERRDALAAKMTPTQIAEAQKLPREWKSSEQIAPRLSRTSRC